MIRRFQSLVAKTKASFLHQVHERYDFGPTARSHVLARKIGHGHPADWEWQLWVALSLLE